MLRENVFSFIVTLMKFIQIAKWFKAAKFAVHAEDICTDCATSNASTTANSLDEWPWDVPSIKPGPIEM